MDKYIVYVVRFNHRYWNGRAMGLGIHQAKLFGTEQDAAKVITKNPQCMIVPCVIQEEK